MKCGENTTKGAWDVLVVDADPAVAELVRKGAGALAEQVRVATSVDAAEAEMKRRPADVLVVNLQISDSAGMELIRSLRRKYPRSAAIALSRVRRSEVCLDAWRAGAADLLMAPVQVQDVKRTLTDLCGRRAEVRRLAERNERLRQVCKQLNKARHDISRQVDLLCNDLVRAYQDLALQLNQAQLAADYAELVADEIDIERILRKTMEWVLKRLGPVNAALYLPGADSQFALGAYLNLDTSADAALIEAMSRTLVRQAQGSGGVALEGDQMIDELFGEEGAGLKGRAWLAVPCRAKQECMAVLVVFRRQPSGQSAGVDGAMRGVAEAAAPILGERIQQALAFFHRLHPYPEDTTDEYGEAQA